MPQNPMGVNIGQSASGAAGAPSLDAQKSLSTSDRHGKYYKGVYAGTTFSVASQAGTTLSAGLATTYTGLCLSNPAGSGKNLALQRVGGVLTVAPAATLAIGLLGGYLAAGLTVHTTPLVPVCNIIGNSANAPVGLADAACTLVGTPAWLKWIATNAASAGLFGFTLDLDGSIIVPPGGYLAFGASVAGPASGFFGSMDWEELPL